MPEPWHTQIDIPPMKNSLQENIERQRQAFSDELHPHLAALGDRCRAHLDNQEQLEILLKDALMTFKDSKYLYVMDAEGVQITVNVAHGKTVDRHLGRNRSQRPYMQGVGNGGADFLLSDAYISKKKRRPSVTGIQTIRDDHGLLLGYVGIDYDLRKLPAADTAFQPEPVWTQVKGDPSIRNNLFGQTRAETPMDQNIDAVLALVVEMIRDRGFFHGKLHFSSSRATMWLVDDPYNYRIMDYETLSDPDICLVYPRRPYFEKAVVPEDKLEKIFSIMRELRFADDTVYLRSGALNISNGMVSLNFSCDGSHYIPWKQFVDQDVNFWFGL